MRTQLCFQYIRYQNLMRTLYVFFICTLGANETIRKNYKCNDITIVNNKSIGI